MGNGDETIPPGDPAESGERRALVGTTLGAYKIEKLLGEGAMGEVFLATHVALGRPVALKMLKPAVAADRSLTERFFAEARAVNFIRHENIVECTDLVNDPKASYIVMELLEGQTLGDAIAKSRRLPVQRAARIAAQIADAIGAAHGKGIVHRDLKPDNVFLIRRAGSQDYVKVLDFGIARLRPELGVSATQSGALIGTPAYMSPEQVRGEKAGPSSDIYALGAILFHMLTGRMPFEAASLSMMLVAQLQEIPASVDTIASDVPRAMVDVVARALAKEVSKRPADMATFRREVLEAAGLSSDPNASLTDSSPALPRPAAASVAETVLPMSAGQSSISASAGQVVEQPARRSKTWLFAVAGAVVVAGAIAAFVIAGGSKDRSQANALIVANPEMPKPEPPKPELKVETVKPEPVKPEPVEPPKPEPPKPDPVKAEPPRPKPPKLDPAADARRRELAEKTARDKAEKERLRKEAEAAKAKPADPAIDCSLDGFMRVYQSCSDKPAAHAALARLNRCQSSSKLPGSVDYDVVKGALVKCF